MAYDLNDWAKTASGAGNPYDIKPYAVWPLVSPTLPFADGLSDNHSGGAAYNPATRRIYWVHTSANGALPIVHVWEVASANSIGPGGEGRLESLGDISLDASGRFLNFAWATASIERTATIRILDVKGALQREGFAISGDGKPAGYLSWDLSGLRRGVYFVEVRSGSATASKKIHLVR